MASPDGETLDSGGTLESGGEAAPFDQQGYDSGASAGTSDSGEVKFNPAWNGLLEKIPEQFHTIVAPDLKQWDKNYNSLAQQYAPWKSFTSQGVTPDSLQKAYQVYQTINNNPMEVYRRLGEALKDQLPSQEQQASKEEPDFEETGQNVDPNYKALQEKFDQLQQVVQNDFQSRQQSYMESQYEQQIDTVLTQIEQANGAFDKPDVLKRVAAQLQMGEQPDIVKAYQEQQAFIQRYQSQQNSNTSTPPRVGAPNGGGTPSTVNSTDVATEEGRKAKFMELLRIAQQGQG